jgi:hypothetical protein
LNGITDIFGIPEIPKYQKVLEFLEKRQKKIISEILNFPNNFKTIPPGL